MAKLNSIYYVTAGSGREFITDYTQYAIRSLIQTGVPLSDIHCVVNNDSDLALIKKLIPTLLNVVVCNENLSTIKWKHHKGKRKFSLFKAAALRKHFPQGIVDRGMVYFDGDVLFFNNPTEYLLNKSEKTWFHHGKDLALVSSRRNNGKPLTKGSIDVKDFRSLSRWVSEPCAWLMIKRHAQRIPDREAVAGFYLLHPSVHEDVLKMTYDNCVMLAEGFKDHVDCGDQKPMNAALNTLNVDWHGGSRFECPDHTTYFDHYFGGSNRKYEFFKLARWVLQTEDQHKYDNYQIRGNAVYGHIADKTLAKQIEVYEETKHKFLRSIFNNELY